MTFRELLSGMSPAGFRTKYKIDGTTEEAQSMTAPLARYFRGMAYLMDFKSMHEEDAQQDEPQIDLESRREIARCLASFPEATPFNNMWMHMVVERAMKKIYPDDDSIYLACRECCRGGQRSLDASMESMYEISLL